MLQQRSLCYLQQFALLYHLKQEREEEFKKFDANLRQLSFFSNPKLYHEWYKDEEENKSEDFFDEDIFEIDKILEQIEKGNKVTITNDDLGEWV